MNEGVCMNFELKEKEVIQFSLAISGGRSMEADASS